jgi:predicted Zn-dependent protease
MQGRVENVPVRQLADSTEFLLVRAKLRAEQGSPESAVAFYRDVLRDRRFAHEWVARYGYAVALARAKDFKAAGGEIDQARRLGPKSPMLDNLHAAILVDLGDFAGARAAYEKALAAYPDNGGLRYGYVELLQRQGNNVEALAVLDQIVRDRPRDQRAYFLQAKSYSALGRRFEQHRALAEAYALQGALPAAIQQLEYAQASGQGDFYSLSAVDARARDLRRVQAEENAENRGKRPDGR